MSAPASTTPTTRLVLILSSERSGSTLLRVMLGRHRAVVSPSEIFLMRYPDYDTWRRLKPPAIESLVEFFAIAGRTLSASEIDAACRGRSAVDVYRWLLSALPSGGVLIDKTPAYANSLETLQRSLALTPYYVWLIRHPLAIIESHVRIKQPRGLKGRLRAGLRTLTGAGKSGMGTLARLRETKWLLQQTNIHTFLAGVPDSQKLTVHFEDLVADPEAVLRPLCAGIGLEFEPTMLDAKDHRRRKMHPDLGDPNFHHHDRVEREKATAWQEKFSESELGFETRRLMRLIGVRGTAAGDT
ncbi:sulfotransferase [Candidatus Binatia bacterium]|nr:sulfotransferase [Candidatus Binatia bacterium]